MLLRGNEVEELEIVGKQCPALNTRSSAIVSWQNIFEVI